MNPFVTSIVSTEIDIASMLCLAVVEAALWSQWPVTRLISPDLVEIFYAVVIFDDWLEGRGNLALLQAVPIDALEERVPLNFQTALWSVPSPLGRLTLKQSLQKCSRLVAEVSCMCNTC